MSTAAAPAPPPKKKNEVVKVEARTAPPAATAPGKYLGTPDNVLIRIAQDFALNLDKHAKVIADRAKRAVEDFWRLGEALDELYRRRTPEDRKSQKWDDVVESIGISKTRAHYARKLFQESKLENLAQYKNTTAALRKLTILKDPKSDSLRAVPDSKTAESKTTQPAQVAEETPADEPTAEILDVTPPPTGDDPEFLAAYNHRVLASVRKALQGITYLEGESVELLDEIGSLVDELRASISNVAPTA